MTDDSVLVDKLPKCAWCRHEIHDEPRELRFRGRSFLVLCSACADNIGQAAQALTVLGSALVKKSEKK